MADQVKYPGRLIAVDGSRGNDTAAAAAAVVDQLRTAGVECAISRWDASGLFGELASTARGDRNISMRTLALVYAADLAFRLRWEIRPVLEAGGVVVASPYVETAVAFGSSCGLSEDWTRRLLRFAPEADVRGRAEERKVDRPWKRRADRGYAEYCAVMLGESASRKVAKRARQEMMQRLEHARGRNSVTLTDKGVEAVAESVTGSRRAAPHRSPSRPRTARR